MKILALLTAVAMTLKKLAAPGLLILRTILETPTVSPNCAIAQASFFNSPGESTARRTNGCSQQHGTCPKPRVPCSRCTLANCATRRNGSRKRPRASRLCRGHSVMFSHQRHALQHPWPGMTNFSLILRGVHNSPFDNSVPPGVQWTNDSDGSELILLGAKNCGLSFVTSAPDARCDGFSVVFSEGAAAPMTGENSGARMIDRRASAKPGVPARPAKRKRTAVEARAASLRGPAPLPCQLRMRWPCTGGSLPRPATWP